MNYPYAQEILQRLWIGDCNSAHDRQFLHQNNIQVIVNCTKDLPNWFEPVPTKPLDPVFLEENFIKYYRIPVDDNGRPEEVTNFWNIIPPIIGQVLQDFYKGKSVLIHCSAGQQRSCAFAAHFLKNMGYNDEQAFQQIVSRRPNAFNFGQQVNFLK